MTKPKCQDTKPSAIVSIPRIMSGAISHATRIFAIGEINDICRKYQKIMGEVKTWAARDILNSSIKYFHKSSRT